MIAREEAELERPEEPDERLAQLATVVGFVETTDAYILEAVLRQGQSQAAVAQRLKVSQQAIAKRLDRIAERLKFASTLETWNAEPEQMREDLHPLASGLVAFAVVLWASRFSRPRTAEALGSKQSTVRTQVRTLRRNFAKHASVPSVAPYGRDLARVDEGGFWQFGSCQKHGSRSIRVAGMT